MVSIPPLWLSTRLPAMPTLSTPGAASPCAATSRAARKSGQRLFVSGVDAEPSVIESPIVTTAPGAVRVETSTRDRKNHDSAVESTGSSAAPVWSPGVDR